MSALGFIMAATNGFGPPPPGTSESFALNVLAWLAAVSMVAGLALIVKKLFGRSPSLSAVLAGLTTTKQLDDYKDEQHLRNRGLEEQIGKIRHDTSDALMQAMAREDARDKVIATLRDIISRLQERTETHIRKLDRNDTTMESLLSKLAGLTERKGT